MEELIFIAVLVFFSIVESIARSRKRGKGGQLPEAPEEIPAELEKQWEADQERRRQQSTRPRPRMSDVPTYDDDASFDSRMEGQEEGRSFDVRRGEAEPTFDEAASSDAERGKRAASSESMIPADIWEEIAGLAREAKVELPAPRPKPRPRIPQTQLPPERRVPQPRAPFPPTARPRPATLPRPSVLPAPGLEGSPDHAVHRSHADYGSDPSERARSAQDGLDPLARASSPEAAAVRQQLRGQGAQALREALVLREVLGPPKAFLPDPFPE